jgi:hypothetical protein
VHWIRFYDELAFWVSHWTGTDNFTEVSNLVEGVT